jgi:GLPGLI family protein
MKRLKYISVFLLLLTAGRGYAQNTLFLSEGQIEFEKRLNLYSKLNEDNTWSEIAKKAMPKFKTTYFNLAFSKGMTLYQPGRENPDNNKLWQQPAEENVVYSDFDNGKSISQKKVFEQLFLVQDSLRRIQWKITDETRTIAGFQCRRANAIIMDSVYVVAFYTDEIISSGGPESFSGLPGMILGVALPHQHVTWFATKIYARQTTEADFRIPAKGKKVNNRVLKETLQDSFKDWGKDAQWYIEATML